MNEPRRVVIAGGGLAGARTAQTLRDLGYEGSLTLLCAEHRAPYDRPPLSKDYLKGDFPEAALDLIAADRYAELGIDLVIGDPATSIDVGADVVGTASGRRFDFDALVVATGAAARALPVFAGSSAAMSLRSAGDAVRLRAALVAGHRVVIVGGGFIGLEVAAAARVAGCPVTVVEALPAPLVGVLGDDVASWLQQCHEANGVDFRCGVTVESATPTSSGERLALSDGTALHADVVVVGVGITRDTGWLRHAGLDVHLGLVCDDAGRTNRPRVWGAGDIVCRHRDGVCDHVQHWTAATLSTRKVAHDILGRDIPATPDDAFFWSDQYDLKMQFVGHAPPGSTVEVASGDLGTTAFTAMYVSADGRETAAFGVNSPREFLRLRSRLRGPAKPAGVT
jgi:3-phenylpropionate/trans-cinnamate dioxygenase ferredoxin reductase component